MPKVVKISRAAIPHVEFVKGMKTYISVCEQTVGSENLMMGACYHDADMDDLVWDAKKEESFFVAKGRIKLLWENAAGERGEVTAEEGERRSIFQSGCTTSSGPPENLPSMSLPLADPRWQM